MSSVSQIWGLQLALDSKAAQRHSHRIVDIEGLREALEQLASDLAAIEVAPGGDSDPHYISDISGLGPALDGKASISDLAIVGAALDAAIAALGGKAESSHTHAIAQVSGLQAALDGKAGTGTATNSAPGLMGAADKTKLDNLSTDGGASTIAQVAGLQTALDDKAAIAHTHAGLASANPSLLTYTVSQSSNYQNNYACTYANLTDGSLTTGGGTNNETGLAWIAADLGSIKTISQVSLAGGLISGYGNAATYLNGSVLEVSTDGSNWAIVLSTINQITDSAATTFALWAIAARYVRIRKNTGYLACTEFRILG